MRLRRFGFAVFRFQKKVFRADQQERFPFNGRDSASDKSPSKTSEPASRRMQVGLQITQLGETVSKTTARVGDGLGLRFSGSQVGGGKQGISEHAVTLVRSTDR